jgi:outer membrane protein insertion porin family
VALALAAAAWPCAYLAGQQPGQGDIVSDVRVVGNSSVELAKIVPYIKTRAGRPYDSQLVLEDIRRLNRSRMFASVSTENRREPGGGLAVIFRVVERPTLQYVKYIGLRSALERNMQDETNLKVGEPVDPYAVSEGKRKIEEYYKGKGFNLVQVTILEGTKPTDRGASYLIHEGPRQQVTSIQFYGNTIVTGRRLATQIQTGSVWFGYLWGYLDMAKVDEDVKILEKYYKNLGFLTARIGRQLDFDESQTYCTVRFVIDEGPRCEINSVNFVGVNKFRVEDLQGMLKLKTGEPFDGTTLLRDKATIEQIYGSYGYVFADVKAEPKVTEDASRMDLVFVIEEGKRYRVGEIRVQIEGEHPHTNIRTVLNRIELQPGDIVDVRKLRRSEARLQRSQLFAVDPQRGIRPQLVVQPVGDPEGDLIGSKPKSSTASSSTSRPSSSASRSSGTSPGGFRGQSPDDWQPDDQFVPLRLVGQANGNAAPVQNDQGLPPPGTLPDGRYPPPLRPRVHMPGVPGAKRSEAPAALPPNAWAPRPEQGGAPTGWPTPAPQHAASHGSSAGASLRLAPATPSVAPARPTPFRSWGAVPITRP